MVTKCHYQKKKLKAQIKNQYWINVHCQNTKHRQGLVLCHIHKSGMIYRSMLSVETISRHSVDILTKLSSADTILDILANSYRSSVGISIHALGLEYLFTNIPTRDWILWIVTHSKTADILWPFITFAIELLK